MQRVLSQEWRPGFPSKSLLSSQLLLLLTHQVDPGSTFSSFKDQSENCVCGNWFWDFADSSLVADQRGRFSGGRAEEDLAFREKDYTCSVKSMAIKEEKFLSTICKGYQLD